MIKIVSLLMLIPLLSACMVPFQKQTTLDSFPNSVDKELQTPNFKDIETEERSDTLGAKTSQPRELSSALALQLGFSDEHVVQASREGATLFFLNESNIGGTPYVAFYLVREHQPRLLNDFATIILIYVGTSEAVGDFLYRIEIREQISIDIISGQPKQTDTSFSISFYNPVLVAYEVAGFQLRSMKVSVDALGIKYYAAILHLDSLYYALTFEMDESSEIPYYLERFRFPLIPPEGVGWKTWAEENGKYWYQNELDYRRDYLSDLSDKEIATGYYTLNFPESSFDEAWSAEKSDIVPTTYAEKALFALGCNFNAYGHIDRNEVKSEQVYREQTYILYSCTLLSDYHGRNVNGFNDFANDNFVSIFINDEHHARLLWNALFVETTSTKWDDINTDGVPDIEIQRFQFYNAYFDRGDVIVQLTSTGELVDLLYGIDKIPNASFADASFSDVDGDGISEFVVSYRNKYLLGACGACGSGPSMIASIYRLEDEFYYTWSTEQYPRLCKNSIIELQQRSDLTTGQNGMGHVFDAFSMLITCDAVGMTEQGWELFLDETEPEYYSLMCQNWLSNVRQGLEQFYTGNGRFAIAENLYFFFSLGQGFDEAYNNCQWKGEINDTTTESQY